MGDDNGSDGARARLVSDLTAIHANLARLRVPPLLDAEIALRLDDDDLAAVVAATRKHLARMATALEDAQGVITPPPRRRRA